MELTTADNVMTVETATSMTRPVSDRDSPLFAPLSDAAQPGQPAPPPCVPPAPLPAEDAAGLYTLNAVVDP